MKNILIVVASIVLISCKKNYNCSCEVNREYYVNGVYTNSESYNQSTTIGNVSKSYAKNMCSDKAIVTEEANWKAVDSYKCKLK